MTYKKPIILLWLCYFLTLYTPHVFPGILVAPQTSYNPLDKDESCSPTQKESEVYRQGVPKYIEETLQLQPYSKQSSNEDWLSLPERKKYRYIDSFVHESKEFTSLRLSIPSAKYARTNSCDISYSPLVTIGSQCQQFCWFNEDKNSRNDLIYNLFLPREIADSQLTVTLTKEKIKQNRLKKSKSNSKGYINKIQLTGFSDKVNEHFFLDITLNPKKLLNQLKHGEEKTLPSLSILKTNPWLEQFNISLLAPITADDEKKSITIKFQPKAEFPNIPEHFKFTLFKEGAITVIPQQGMTLSIPCNQSEENRLITVRVTNKSSATLLGAFVQSLTELWSRNDLSSFSWPLWEKKCALTACKDVLALGASMVLTPIGLSSITPIVPIIIAKASERLYRPSDTASENSSNESNIQEAIKKLRHDNELPVLFFDYEVSLQSRSTTLTVVSKQHLKVEETPSLLRILQVQCKNSVSQTMELLLSDSDSLTDLLESSTLRQLCSRDEQLQTRARALQINDPATWLKNTLGNLRSKKPKIMTSSELVGYMLNQIHKDDDCRKAIALLSGYTAYSPTSQEVSWLLRTHNIPLEHCIVVLESVLSSNKKSQTKPASGSFTRSTASFTQKATLVGATLYSFFPGASTRPTNTPELTTTAKPPSYYKDYLSSTGQQPPLQNICTEDYAYVSQTGEALSQKLVAPKFCQKFDIANNLNAKDSISKFFDIDEVRTNGCVPLSTNNSTPENRYGVGTIQNGTASIDDCITDYATQKCATWAGQQNAPLHSCQVCETSKDLTLRCGYESPTTAPPTTAPQTTAPQTTAPQTTVPQTTAPQTTAPQTTVPGTTDAGIAVSTLTESITTGAAVTTGLTTGQIAGATLGGIAVLTYPINFLLGARGWNLAASPATILPNIYHKCCGTQLESESKPSDSDSPNASTPMLPEAEK